MIVSVSAAPCCANAHGVRRGAQNCCRKLKEPLDDRRTAFHPDLHVKVSTRGTARPDPRSSCGEVARHHGPTGRAEFAAHVLAGKPGYTVTSVRGYAGRDLLALAPEGARARRVFLGFQYPVEIPA